MFDDLIEANRRYVAGGHDGSIEGKAGRGLAVLTCMDTRLDPLAVLGLRPGDAKIIRNAGARVTDDALRSLVLATNLLNADRIAVIQHTRCAMVGITEDEMRSRVAAARGVDSSGWQFLTSTDQVSTLRADIARIRDCPLIAEGVTVAGFVFDVDTGELVPLSR